MFVSLAQGAESNDRDADPGLPHTPGWSAANPGALPPSLHPLCQGQSQLQYLLKVLTHLETHSGHG